MTSLGGVDGPLLECHLFSLLSAGATAAADSSCEGERKMLLQDTKRLSSPSVSFTIPFDIVFTKKRLQRYLHAGSDGGEVGFGLLVYIFLPTVKQ